MTHRTCAQPEIAPLASYPHDWGTVVRLASPDLNWSPHGESTGGVSNGMLLVPHPIPSPRPTQGRFIAPSATSAIGMGTALRGMEGLSSEISQKRPSASCPLGDSGTRLVQGQEHRDAPNSSGRIFPSELGNGL